MSDASPPEPSPPPRAPASVDPTGATPPLDQVVDDATPRREALEWAVDALYASREFDEVEADLVACGWSDEVAASVVEEARRLTRRHRGALTREQVVMEADRMYRRASGRWYVGMPMLAAAWRLLHSVATLMSLRRAGRDRADP